MTRLIDANALLKNGRICLILKPEKKKKSQYIKFSRYSSKG